MVAPLLLRAGRRHLGRHPWLTGLALLGIALGVAVVVAVDLANASAREAFRLSLEALNGRATHRLSAGPAGIANAIVPWLRVEQRLRSATPVVEGTVELNGEVFTLLGIDPFSDGAVRDLGRDLDRRLAAALLTRPRALLVARPLAARLGLAPDQTLTLAVGGRPLAARVAALYDPPNPALAEGVLVADIAAAQELLGRPDRIDRIDLRLDDAQAAALQAALPAGLTLVESGARSRAQREMTEAFHTNLAAMGLLALLVGGFLIYNTLTFSVLRRRSLFGTCRVLGVTGRALFGVILLEALALALVGSLLGLVLGWALGRELVGLVVRTINDLYFRLALDTLIIDPSVLAQGLLLGVGVTLFAALPPALEAARAPPLLIQRRSELEREHHRFAPRLALLGVLLVALGLGIAALPGRSLGPPFTGLFLVVIGWGLVAPLAVLVTSRLAAGPLRRLFGALGGVAVRGIGAGLSRSGVAVAALAIAVAATIGIGSMIGSFRATVADWLGQTLRADLYLASPAPESNRSEGAIDPALVARVAALPGVVDTSHGQTVIVESPLGPLELLALKPAARSRDGFRFRGAPLEGVWERFVDGELVLVSEPFANRFGLRAGDPVTLFTAAGRQIFPVGGVFYDYGTSQGKVVLAHGRYAALWGDRSLSTLGLYLAPGVDPQQVAAEARALVRAGSQPLRVRDTATIRRHSLEVFDRTFAITRVLRLLAIGVAFVGVLTALMALQLERAREHALLRALGVTPWQLGGVIALQTAVMGALAGLLALPLGAVLAELLTGVINLRSFGWTLETRLQPAVLADGLVVAFVAAALAGLYPAWRMARMLPAAALREE